MESQFYNLREEVSCPACWDLFTDPKHLSCLHSFCLTCLKKWHKTHGGGEVLKCPICQTLTRIPASGDLKDLPTSFYLKGLIDVLAIKECEITQLACRNCGEKSSEASYCFHCCLFYCENCLNAHNIMRDKKEHRVLAVKKFKHEDYEDVLKQPVFCSRLGHQNEELKYYCKICETVLCRCCAILDHKGHVLKLIEEEAETKRLEIQSVIKTEKQNLETNMNIMSQLELDCAKLSQQSILVKRDVQRFGDSLVKTIQGKMQKMIGAVEGRTEKSLYSLTAKRNEIQRQINVMESSLALAGKFLQRFTDAELVSSAGIPIFRLLDHAKSFSSDLNTFQGFVFVENQKMSDTINREQVGFLEELYQTKASASFAESGRMKEGICNIIVFMSIRQWRLPLRASHGVMLSCLLLTK